EHVERDVAIEADGGEAEIKHRCRHARQPVLAAGISRQRIELDEEENLGDRHGNHGEIDAGAPERDQSDQIADDGGYDRADGQRRQDVGKVCDREQIGGNHAADAEECGLDEGEQTREAEEDVEAEAEHAPDQDAVDRRRRETEVRQDERRGDQAGGGEDLDQEGALPEHQRPRSFAAGRAEQSVGTQHEHQRHGDEQHDVGVAWVEHGGDADDFAGDQPAQHGARERSDAADDDYDEGLHQDRLADVGGDRDHRRVDDAGEARGHGADAEHQHEDLVDVDAERIDHHGILDAGAHDHADTGAIEHEIERQQRDGDDAEQREAIGRIEHEAERGDPHQRGRRRHRLGQAAEEEAHGLDEYDAEPERDQQLVLMRAIV